MRDLAKELRFDSTDSTTIQAIEKLANELLNVTWTIDIYINRSPTIINLAFLGWCFEFNNNKTSAGLCKSKNNKIYISKWLLSQNLDKALKFEDIIRHEIAHAIDFEIRGKSDHGKVWKAIARKVLCTAERCYSIQDVQTKVLTKYTLKCIEEGCGFERASHKALKKNSRSYPCCNDCYERGLGYMRLEQVQNY